MTELELYLPELNKVQMEWLDNYIALKVVEAEKAQIIKIMGGSDE